MIAVRKDARGFAHHFVLVGGVVGLVLITTSVAVIKAHHSNDAATVRADHSASSQSSTGTSAHAKSTVHTLTPAEASTTPASSTPSTAPTATSKPSSTTKATPSSTTKPSTTTSQAAATSAQTSAPAPAATPHSTLVNIISALLANNGTVYVTATSVTVAGPISDAQARPLVFTLNGQTYFAYHQGSPIDFYSDNKTAEQIADTLAIMQTNTNPSRSETYIDKSGNLTTQDYHTPGTVGYSTGGN